MTVRLRDDYSAATLHRMAKTARTTSASRRMLSLALVLEDVIETRQPRPGPACEDTENIHVSQKRQTTVILAMRKQADIARVPSVRTWFRRVYIAP